MASVMKLIIMLRDNSLKAALAALQSHRQILKMMFCTNAFSSSRKVKTS